MLDWFISTKLPIFDAQGRAVGVMGVIQSYALRRNQTMGGSRLGRVLEHIKTHHRGVVRVPELAKVGGMSRRQLVRKFQSEFGMSPKDFLIKTRIQAASDALLEVDISIAEIAAEFGFSDQSAFTRQFRKTTGMTPLGFQKKYSSRGSGQDDLTRSGHGPGCRV